MTFEDIAEGLGALGKAVADRGGDRSALAATEAFLRAEGETKPAAFQKAAKKAAKNGVRMARATEVRGGAAAQALASLLDLLDAAGAKDSALKQIEGLRDFFAENEELSLEALQESMAEDRAAAAAKPVRKKAEKKA